MAEVRAPRGEEWAVAIEALNRLANALSVRSHYAEGHPAIVRADEGVAAGFARLLEQLPELVVALIDGEVVVCERPMPELRDRLVAVTDAMVRHDVECIVVQHGVNAHECTLLAQTLGAKNETPGVAREQAEGRMTHVLLRYAALRQGGEERRRSTRTPYFVPDVSALLSHVAEVAAADGTLATEPVRALAERIVDACAARDFALEQRCVVPGLAGDVARDGAAHASNVATMVAAMALAGRFATATCVDVTAAALLHDVGHLLMPREMRGVPAPLLDEASTAVFQNHCFVGARLLLGAGCPPLWIAAALEHHRGVDGDGYPGLGTSDPPHELVRLIALANFVDAKSTRLAMRQDVPVCTPDEALRLASSLANRYFAPDELALYRRALGAFPPGTTVELSDRRVAVVRQASGDAFRPEVEILCGPDARKRVDLESIDAHEDRHRLSIVRAVAPPIVLPDVLDALAVVGPPTPLPPAAPPVIMAPPTEAPAPVPSRPAQFVFRRPSAEFSVRPAPMTTSAPPRALIADEAEYREDAALVRLEHLGSLDRVPVLRIARAQLAGLALDRHAGFILSFCDGATPIDAILDMSGLPRADVLRVLDDLVKSGVLALE